MSHTNLTTSPRYNRILLTGAALAALSLGGCANIQDTGPLENQIAKAQEGDFGVCMEESYRAAVELQEAKARLAELQAGSPSDTDMREGMRAAKAAADLRDKAERKCATEYRMANEADAARIAELRQQVAMLSERLGQIESRREVLRGVTFATGKATLSRSARALLNAQAEKLVGQPHRVQVAGYASSIGSQKYNLDLSTRRAEAVREYLIAQGVKADMVVARGFGTADPVASNDTASGRQANQRIELHYL